MRYYNKYLLLRIDEETLKELKQYAKEKQLKVSEVIRQLIYRELKKWRLKKLTYEEIVRLKEIDPKQLYELLQKLIDQRSDVMPRKKHFDAILKIRINSQTYQDLKNLAKTKNTTVSILIRRLINAELRNYKSSTLPRYRLAKDRNLHRSKPTD